MDDPTIEFMGSTLRLTHFVGVDDESGRQIVVQPAEPEDYRIVRVTPEVEPEWKKAARELEARVDMADPGRFRRRSYDGRAGQQETT